MSDTRAQFRETCKDRDGGSCVVPWCEKAAEDVHHIIERKLWEDGGYIPDNGASVCADHHRAAEDDYIPPQAFWLWTGATPVTPEGYGTAITKWGESLDSPPWEEYRDRIKYPSTRHLPFSYIGDDDDTEFRAVDQFVDTPLVVTHKMDGSNAMLLRDTEEPVRARNGKQADHGSFDQLKALYWELNIHERLPDSLQVFGEWLKQRHSIHYGCDCETPCEDVGPALTEVASEYEDRRQAFFQVFGVYHTGLNLWLSWDKTVEVARKLGFPTAPVIEMSGPGDESYVETDTGLYDRLWNHARSVVDEGGEGIVVRSKYPFHYGQFEDRVGKFVRQNHVKTSEHWKAQAPVNNQLR